MPAVTVVVYVHQIDTDIHPGLPRHYRWAVHLNGPANDLETCLNAGGDNDRDVAAFIGESHGAAVFRAIKALGHNVRYEMCFLYDDPVPPDGEVVFSMKTPVKM